MIGREMSQLIQIEVHYFTLYKVKIRSNDEIMPREYKIVNF